MGLINTLFVTRAEDFVFSPIGRDARSPLTVDKDYVSVRLRSARIVNVRKGVTKFYGTVHSHISLLDRRNGTAEYQVVTTPNPLMNIDGKNVERVLSLDLPLLKSVPYRGQLSIELGLFSVVSADLAGEYLSFLERIAETAGVAYLGTAQPFVEVIKYGVDQIFGKPGKSYLEIGLAGGFQAPSTGTFVLLRAPKGTIDLEKYELDPNDSRLVDDRGSALQDYPYLVFSIERSERRHDWFNIPELRTAHESIREAVMQNKAKEAEAACEHFKRACVLSPDLLHKDALELARIEAQKVKEILPATQVGKPVARDLLGPFESLDLYGDHKEH